ncbi:MAG: hypothetical protein CFE45_43755, partial [Burkholderiales bacterium PBB5]
MLRRPSWRWKFCASLSKAVAVTVPAQPVWVPTFTSRPPSSVSVIDESALASSRALCTTSQKAWSSTDMVAPPRNTAPSSSLVPGAGKGRLLTATTRWPSFSSSGAPSSSQAMRQCSSMPVAWVNSFCSCDDKPLRRPRTDHSTRG